MRFGGEPGKGLREWWIDRKTADWQADIARVITSPDAVDELKKLRVLRKASPNVERATDIVGVALTRAGVLGSESAMRPRQSELPPRIPSQPQ